MLSYDPKNASAGQFLRRIQTLTSSTDDYPTDNDELICP